MNIALLDVDGHHYPNLALMKISRWYKSHDDHVDSEGVEAAVAESNRAF